MQTSNNLDELTQCKLLRVYTPVRVNNGHVDGRIIVPTEPTSHIMMSDVSHSTKIPKSPMVACVFNGQVRERNQCWRIEVASTTEHPVGQRYATEVVSEMLRRTFEHAPMHTTDQNRPCTSEAPAAAKRLRSINAEIHDGSEQQYPADFGKWDTELF
jgi:hypothetical protein